MTHQPPRTFHPPAGEKVAADSQRRLKALEQRAQPQAEQRTFTATATLGAPITTEAGQWFTGRWWPWRGAISLENVIVDAQNVGTPSTVEIRRGGVTAIEVSIPESGVYRHGQDERWTVADSLDLTVTGHIGLLMVQLEFRGPGNAAFVFTAPTSGGGG